MPLGSIEHITIVGAGFMGHGIGQEFALAGYPVVLHDMTPDRLLQAVERIRRNLAELAELKVILPAEIEPTLAKIRCTTVLSEAAAGADLVIEAVFEDVDLKRSLFAALDAACPDHTILASNTSTLMPSLLASATHRPARVLNIHYFYPPCLLPLVEIVPGPATDAQIVNAVFRLLKGIGKSPIVVRKEATGFIANRLQLALQREALHIVEQGIASAQDVDIAVKDGFGRRLAVAGPFEIVEPIGWDLELQVQRYLFPDLDRSQAPSPMVMDKVARGELGFKTNQGFYSWTPESAEAWRRHMSAALAGFLSDGHNPTG